LSVSLFLHDLRLPQVELYFRFLSDFADLRQPKVVSFFSIFAHMWQPQVGPNAHLPRNSRLATNVDLQLSQIVILSDLRLPQVKKDEKNCNFSRGLVVTLWRAAARLKPLRRRAHIQF